jgi:hypothetical protein
LETPELAAAGFETIASELCDEVDALVIDSAIESCDEGGVMPERARASGRQSVAQGESASPGKKRAGEASPRQRATETTVEIRTSDERARSTLLSTLL